MERDHPKDGSSKLNGRSMVVEDGKIEFLGSSGAGAPSDGKDSAEVDLPSSTHRKVCCRFVRTV